MAEQLWSRRNPIQLLLHTFWAMWAIYSKHHMYPGVSFPSWLHSVFSGCRWSLVLLSLYLVPFWPCRNCPQGRLESIHGCLDQLLDKLKRSPSSHSYCVAMRSASSKHTTAPSTFISIKIIKHPHYSRLLQVISTYISSYIWINLE